MAFSALFEPIKIGSMEVKNRFVKPPMGSNSAEDDCSCGQRMIDYYSESAKGGFGLITIEVTAVSPEGRAIIRQPGLWCDEQIEGYRKLADALHEHGAKMSVQLHHAGRQTIPPFNGGLEIVAPSPLPCPYCQVVPHELTTEEVYGMIEKFVDAAERAKIAGADAVEVHGAHGYLIAEFMSSYSNRRTDEFGGSFENRLRFPRLIVEGIRERLGKDYPIIFRMSGEEKTVGGRCIAETRAIAKMMEKAGVNAMHIAAGAYGSLEWIWGCSDSPLAYMAKFAEDVKQSVSIPVITVGRINDPYIAEEIIASGRADMVSIGRQSIADAHFPNKIKEGRIDEIIPCVGCHQGCSEEMLKCNVITCAINPFAGHEHDWKLEATTTKKKVIVVGAGPAGLLTASLLAQKGHEVHLYEKESVVGGQYRVAAFPPGKADLAKPIRYYENICNKNGVVMHLSTEVTTELIQETNPDAVVLATGGSPLMPNIEGIDNPKFVKANDVLVGKVQTGKKVLIAGGGLVGTETADYLAEYGRDVSVVEMKAEVGADVNEMVKITLMRRLKDYNVKFIPNTIIKQFKDNGVVCETNGTEHELSDYDTIVLAMGAQAYNPLEDKIKELVNEVYVIGDAKKAGKVLKATQEAAIVAMQI